MQKIVLFCKCGSSWRHATMIKFTVGTVYRSWERTALWKVAPCILTDTCVRLEETWFFFFGMHGVRSFLLNVGKFLTTKPCHMQNHNKLRSYWSETSRLANNFSVFATINRSLQPILKSYLIPCHFHIWGHKATLFCSLSPVFLQCLFSSCMRSILISSTHDTPRLYNHAEILPKRK